MRGQLDEESIDSFVTALHAWVSLTLQSGGELICNQLVVGLAMLLGNGP